MTGPLEMSAPCPCGTGVKHCLTAADVADAFRAATDKIGRTA